MRPAHFLLLCALLLGPIGCDSGTDREQDAAARQETAEHPGTESTKERLIRDWLGALNRGDYDHAATFFAPGALIDQGIPYHLRSRALARLWNSGLPCRADLIEVARKSERVVATFRLRAGPGGPCDGTVRVRFAFRGERFSEFVQLAPEEPQPGETV